MEDKITLLRQSSRKLIRELGVLDLNALNSQETPAYYHALIEISKDASITISKLGQILLLTPSTVSRLVKSLKEENLISVSNGKDKREKFLSLKHKGLLKLQQIDAFSNSKIKGAFKFLTEKEQENIIRAIETYGQALEKSRNLGAGIKIATLSTSRPLRKFIIEMIENIQKNEFSISVSDEINKCILRAEEHFHYNHSCNFWYATDLQGKILGSIGLKKINHDTAEIKKFFVIKSYRGKGVAQKLMSTLVKNAFKHHFKFLVLGTVGHLEAAQKFYTKHGFILVSKKDLPLEFDYCPLDTLFFKASSENLANQFYKLSENKL